MSLVKVLLYSLLFVEKNVILEDQTTARCLVDYRSQIKPDNVLFLVNVYNQVSCLTSISFRSTLSGSDVLYYSCLVLLMN